MSTPAECARCETVTDTPVRDEYAASWFAETPSFCSQDCLSEAAEAYWTARWSA